MRAPVAGSLRISEVGVGGLRTRDIADRAGVNVATLHYCFGSKDGLLAALYDHILTQVRAEADTYLAGVVGPTDRLRATSALRLHFLRNRPASVQAWRAFAEGVWTSETVRCIMRRHFAEQRTKLAAIIAEGRSQGVLGSLPTPDDNLMASILIGLYDGLIFQWAADPDGFPVDEYETAVLSWLGLTCGIAKECGQEP